MSVQIAASRIIEDLFHVVILLDIHFGYCCIVKPFEYYFETCILTCSDNGIDRETLRSEVCNCNVLFIVDIRIDYFHIVVVINVYQLLFNGFIALTVIAADLDIDRTVRFDFFTFVAEGDIDSDDVGDVAIYLIAYKFLYFAGGNSGNGHNGAVRKDTGLIGYRNIYVSVIACIYTREVFCFIRKTRVLRSRFISVCRIGIVPFGLYHIGSARVVTVSFLIVSFGGLGNRFIACYFTVFSPYRHLRQGVYQQQH